MPAALLLNFGHCNFQMLDLQNIIARGLKSFQLLDYNE